MTHSAGTKSKTFQAKYEIYELYRIPVVGRTFFQFFAFSTTEHKEVDSELRKGKSIDLRVVPFWSNFTLKSFVAQVTLEIELTCSS